MAGVKVRTEAVFGKNALGRFASEIEDGIGDALDEMGEIMERQATANVMPLGAGRIGPRLRKKFRVVRAGGKVYLESLDPLTGIFEFGTKRWYTIAPRGDAALTNIEEGFGPVTNPDGTAKPVQHPGQPPGNFLLNTYRYALGCYMGVLRDHLPG